MERINKGRGKVGRKNERKRKGKKEERCGERGTYMYIQIRRCEEMGIGWDGGNLWRNRKGDWERKKISRTVGWTRGML